LLKGEKEGSVIRQRVDKKKSFGHSLDSVVNIFLPHSIVFWTWVWVKERISSSVQVHISGSVNVTSDWEDEEETRQRRSGRDRNLPRSNGV